MTAYDSTAESSAPPRTRSSSGWVGWIVFAGVMMMMIGTFHLIEGLVALFQDSYYLVNANGLTVHVDYTAWGWVHLLAGILIGVAGIGVLGGRVWARTIGVIMAVISALLNFAFIAAYPFWSAIVIALDVFIIMALTVHGRDIESA